MPRKKNDASYLSDMLKACQEIETIVIGKTCWDFERDMIVRYAIERLIEILGEAARHVSEPFKVNHPEIPWNGIMPLRYLV